MGDTSLRRIKEKIQDHMLLGSIYDNVMLKTKYRDAKLSFLYNVMIGQKHRMLYYKTLKRKYLEKVTADRPWETLEKKANQGRIWFCWLQGLEQAPPLVKLCYEALRQKLPDREIVVIDAKNVFDYIRSDPSGASGPLRRILDRCNGLLYGRGTTGIYRSIAGFHVQLLLFRIQSGDYGDK